MKKKKKANIEIFKKTSVVLVLFTFLFLFLIDLKTKNVTETAQTVYPSLYSFNHINQTAIEKDPRFKDLVVFEKPSFLANVKTAFDKRDAKKPTTDKKDISKSDVKEFGSWIWTPTKYLYEDYSKQIIKGAKENNINVIYLSINSYLDIYGIENKDEKEKMIYDFEQKLLSFIDEANKNNIEVDFTAGWKNWAEEGHLYKPFAIADFTIDFNKKYPDKIRGLQYDIEPYLLEEYQSDKKTVLKNLLLLSSELTYKLQDENFQLSFVVPEFYDASNGETPRFYFGNKRTSTFNHLLKILDQKENSKIIVMSYRNFAIGEDGSIDISKDEIQSANSYSTKVIVAQETGDFPPSYITFFNTKREYLDSQLKKIEDEFKDDKSFDGLAIHYINTFLEMR